MRITFHFEFVRFGSNQWERQSITVPAQKKFSYSLWLAKQALIGKVCALAIREFVAAHTADQYKLPAQPGAADV